jgi:hypothetical protein
MDLAIIILKEIGLTKILKGIGETENERMDYNSPFHPFPLSPFQFICFAISSSFSINKVKRTFEA